MFFQKHPFSLLLALMVVFLASCAAPKSPTGGPVDTLPPVIIAEESTPNQQTNFKEDEITITFDEWFTIKVVSTQLVISPLMPEQPVVKQKGKSILITLPAFVAPLICDAQVNRRGRKESGTRNGIGRGQKVLSINTQ